MNYDVIVIGAGNGGLSSAAKLAVSGKKVLVLEKHNIPGGCGTSFRRGRFEFEVALHQLSSLGTQENPGDLRKLFKEYGFVDEIEWIEIESLYKVSLPGGFGQHIPTNRVEAIKVLSASFPKEKDAIQKYYDVCYKFYDESEDFAAASANSTGDASFIKKLLGGPVFKAKYPTLVKYLLKSTQEVLDEFFIDENLKAVFNVYWCFMGMSPDRFPFSINAKCLRIYTEDKPYYLKGGSQVISQALANTIEKNGGTMKYNCGCKEILVKDNQAYGVIDDEGNTYDAKYIISGIGPVETYFKLINEDNQTAEMKEYLKPYKPGISALTCFIALDCPPNEVGFTDSFNLIYNDTDCVKAYQNSYDITPDKDPLITTCYTVDDPSVGPAGTSIITAGTLKYSDAWEKLDPTEYYDKKYECCNVIIERLEKFYPGIGSHIEEATIATPLTHMRYLNHPKGSIYGFEQDMHQSGLFFPNKDLVKNLTFSNGWVNVCGFGPNYLNGAKVATKVLKELK